MFETEPVMSGAKSYILYGASFNPPHMGHFSAISQMLEEYDKVLVFPYPRKHGGGILEELPPISQRMGMLKEFIGEFFPQMAERLVLSDLSSKMGIKDRVSEGVLHTYDYLQYVKELLPLGSSLSVCLGFEAKNLKEDFFREADMEREFGVFRLEEESSIKSQDLRDFFSTHSKIKNAKEERYVKNAVGTGVAEYIFKHNLYGVKNFKKPEAKKNLSKP